MGELSQRREKYTIWSWKLVQVQHVPKGSMIDARCAWTGLKSTRKLNGVICWVTRFSRKIMMVGDVLWIADLNRSQLWASIVELIFLTQLMKTSQKLSTTFYGISWTTRLW